MDTAAVLGPAVKDASVKVEGMAKKAISEYGPKAQQAAKDFEQRLAKLSSDVSNAVKVALKSKTKPAAKKAAGKKIVKKTTKTAGRARKVTRPKRGAKR